MEDHLRRCDSCCQRHGELETEELLAQRLRTAFHLSDTRVILKNMESRLAGHYELLHEIGQGAGSVIFKASDT